MSSILYEDFAGTASLAGTTPEINMPSAGAWVVTGAGGEASQLKNANGWLAFTPVSGVGTTIAYAQVGDTATPRGLGVRSVATFEFTTNGSAVDGYVYIAGLYSGISYSAIIRQLDGVWTIGVGATVLALPDLVLVANRPYPVIFFLDNGFQSLTVFGRTITSSTAFSGAAVTSGLTGYNVGITLSTKFRFTGSGVGREYAASSLPSLTLSSEPNPPEPINGSANLTLAALGVRTAGGSSALVGLPALRSTSLGRDSTGDQSSNITLPGISADITAGANAKARLPMLSAGTSGTVTGLATATVSLPGVSTSVNASVTGLGSVSVSLPSFSTASFAGALCSVTIGGVTALVAGTTGAVGRAQITLPLFEASATATAQNRGAAHITLPSLRMGATARAPLTLPSLQLTAIGTAVVVPTYEAYAVNLNHPPAARGQELPVDETTRYTNYPFTHIVRYQNSYYGANSTGLYLLEGTTDDAAPIPWEFKTTITDFESPMAKTAVSAYFAGRMGPEATVGIHLGESGDVSYSHSTPRGPAAQNYRQVFGLGLKARYYALSVAGEGVMELDSVEFNNKTLTRRI